MTLTDLDRTAALKADDPCEFRFPARKEWRPGFVIHNGGSGYWRVIDSETGEIVNGLYIEHIRAEGTDPWGWLT